MTDVMLVVQGKATIIQAVRKVFILMTTAGVWSVTNGVSVR